MHMRHTVGTQSRNSHVMVDVDCQLGNNVESPWKETCGMTHEGVSRLG